MIRAAELINDFRYALENKWGYIWGAAGILWTEAKQKQKVNYMVSNYGTSWKINSEAKNDKYYGSALNGSKWIGHYVADCSGLFAWAFKKHGGAIAHGSNSIWDRYCSSKGKLNAGKRTDGKDLIPGTAVLTGNDQEHGHIGLYVGNGKVIEASGVTAGVCTSNLTATKWRYWGELKGIEYEKAENQAGQPSETDPANDTLPTVRRGDKGQYVTLAQTALVQRGYNIGSCGIDGDFGPATEKAVKQFQRDWGLKEDGIIGPQTWNMLLNSPVREKKYSVTIYDLTKAQAEKISNSYPGSMIKEE